MTGAVAAGAVLAAPGSASAVTLHCEVSVSGTFATPMKPAGGSGTYSASTGGIVNREHCTFDATVDSGPATMTTRGTYVASSCGNGVLTGDPTWRATSIDVLSFQWNPLVGQMAYTLELRGWQAILRVTRVNGHVELGGDDVDGVLTMVPQHACLSAPVETFTLDGTFVVEWW